MQSWIKYTSRQGAWSLDYDQAPIAILPSGNMMGEGSAITIHRRLTVGKSNVVLGRPCASTKSKSWLVCSGELSHRDLWEYSDIPGLTILSEDEELPVRDKLHSTEVSTVRPVEVQ